VQNRRTNARPLFVQNSLPFFCFESFRLVKDFDGSGGLDNDIQAVVMGKIDNIFRDDGAGNRADKTLAIFAVDRRSVCRKSSRMPS